ncbi:histidine kinase [Trinickia symbiotica]|uniref:Histidine kinase n=1 Tax=Trinickia symbiotica TaxID=863227 RepID=A0A2T3XVP7_9BURK|nr:PAS domain-containing protein [Trinickia symbiotica]PTB20565.1 histidine kinase [Trinickia symbiotica]
MNSPDAEVQVLLVEDSPTDAWLIEDALSEVSAFKLRLLRAERLSEAAAQLRAVRVDVVLLDLGLPDAQGLDTFRAFHRQAPDLPVLVLTGLDDMSVGLLAIHEGAQDYLLKRDIEPSLLRRAIHYAIERHSAAAALAASEERFQLAVRGATAGLWDWNLQSDDIYFSPQFKAILGYEDHELPNERRAHLDAIHPDDTGRVREALNAHLEHRRPFDVEYRLLTRSGQFRWVQSRGQAHWDVAGKPYRMVSWVIDISDRKRNEEALRTSREELKRLSGHTQQVREEEKARIARELHDDLGQQLTALKMAVTLLQQDLDVETSSRSSVGLRGIYTLIDGLIDSVRRISADLRPAMLDDLGLIPTIEWLIKEFSIRSGMRVTSRFDVAGVAFSRESRIEVFRIVQESLTNVARHSGATEVMVAIEHDNRYCIVRISDNGRGAARDASPSRHSLGLLGLRERAARLHGEIRIRTAPGSGFSLTAILPLEALVSAS